MIMLDFLRVRKSEADTSKIRKILVKNFVFNSKKVAFAILFVKNIKKYDNEKNISTICTQAREQTRIP